MTGRGRSFWREHGQLVVVLAFGALVAAAVTAPRWWRVLTEPRSDRYEFMPGLRPGDLCPVLKPGLRHARGVLPDIPHLVTHEGEVPACYRTRTYLYSTTSRSFRGTREFANVKPPDTFRILVFGTGVTFGNGVDEEWPWPLRLEHYLNEARPTGAPRFQVYNLAIPGSTTERGVANLKSTIEQGMAFDYAIFCYGVNDGLAMFKVSPEEYSASLAELVALKKRHGFRMLFAVEPRSSFYPWNYAGYIRQFDEQIRSDSDNEVIDLPALLDRVEADHGLRLEQHGAYQAVVRYREREPAVLFRTLYDPSMPGAPQVAPETYDFLDRMVGLVQACYIDDVHLSEEGHDVVAGLIAERLLSQGVRREPRVQ